MPAVKFAALSRCSVYSTTRIMPAPKSIQRPLTTVAKNLARLRAAAKLSQEALGDKAGISRTSVNHIETGKHAPGSDTLEALARALGVRPSELTDEPGGFEPMASAIEAFLASPWGQASEATPEELAWLRTIRGESLFGFGPGGPSPKAIHHLLEARRAQPK